MYKLIHRHTISFKNAFNGVIWALKSQPNFRVHLVLSLIAILLSFYFKVTYIEFLIILFTILLGLVTEMLNTCVESMTDLITTEWKKDAKIAKDVAAGMMLLVAVGAVIVAVYIFVPYITK